MDWLPKRARKCIFFTPFWPFLAQKLFPCKTAYAISKVVYQASYIPKIQKIYGLVAKKCSKTHIFHTFFAIIGQKFFFSKIRLRRYHKELPWYQKSEKTMEPFKRNLYRRTDVREQIYSPSQNVVSVQKRKARLLMLAEIPCMGILWRIKISNICIRKLFNP